MSEQATQALDRWIEGLPKIELHLHIEGSLEPEMMFKLSQRNSVVIPYASVDEIRKAYSFGSLQDFLDLYYQGMSVLLHEVDFYELAMAYFTKAHENNVRHAEIFFDPQAHTSRGVSLTAVVSGIKRAMSDAEAQFGVTSHLILSFLRHLTEEDGFAVLELLDKENIPKETFIGVGLDSSEVGNPPTKFERLFQKCRECGWKTVAHAGEEGPPSYIVDSIEKLSVARIDHGVKCLQDPNLVARLREGRVPLTVCPLSNLKLRVVKDGEAHPLYEMVAQGLCAAINSDDPAYFKDDAYGGGYMNANYKYVLHNSGPCLTDPKKFFATVCRNAIASIFSSEEKKKSLSDELENYILQN